ncbi:helix-turn-helix domain-containing protein [Neobacillus jeddahensis]|uniref:helix-turn-helix domain-containing protein n=1 Tax=Neobacillus jeddahensis TaxID=1461580 RepID=UPI00058DC63C|nr:helix-turn-helix domain-containing protein [Neobacillus jeddahensis]
MQQFETIILYCLKQLNSERTIYSIFHLLNGKKSSQTIQDAHLFSLKKFFGIYEPLTRESFDEIIYSMLEKEWVVLCGDQRYHLTQSGKVFLDNTSLPTYLNGWSFHPVTTLFWERLSLFVQVTSNLVYGEARYLPIQKNKDVHLWLKTKLKEIDVPRSELGNKVFTELTDCFNMDKKINPALVVFRLTGYQQIGLTPLQTAKKLDMNIHEYHIGFIHTLHYLLQNIIKDPLSYSILAILISDMKQEDELTITSRKTWKLLNQGYNLEQIAEFRHLKVSTIEDHIVEFSLHIDGFSIDPYVDKDLQMKIIDIARDSETRQLKRIKEKLEAATYFQIRLVLAKYGER